MPSGNSHRKPLGHPHRKEGDPFVIPPAYHIERAGHHWLQVRDYDGHAFGYIVLQWQPGARQWCHSFQYARGENVNVDYYEYVGPCAQPLRADEQQLLKKFIKEVDDTHGVGTGLEVTGAKWDFFRKILEPLLP